jgi:RsbT co-antagonist protein rsbRD N-terminal domain
MDRETQAPASEPPRLCDFLRQNHQQILEQWSTAVRALPVAAAMSQPRLIDHPPELLRVLAGYTETAHTGKRPTLSDLPKTHALDRLDVGFDLKQVSKEYALLRDCVLSMYERAV